VPDVSNDDAQDAANGALEHFAELVRILDEALTSAIRADDRELVEKLERAKGAAEYSHELVGKICAIMTSDEEDGHRSAL
jgi:hypothetical protein